MTYALLVIGNGRLDYLHKVVEAAEEHLHDADAYLMIDDSGRPEINREIARTYPDWETLHHSSNWGMAKAVQSGFEHVLSTACDYVFWLEEDMLLTARPPIHDAISVLDNHPTSLAQMCFRREPWWGSPAEMQHGDQLTAIVEQADDAITVHWHEHVFTAHDFIFSLNPCLIPRHILEMGWPSGPIGVGNETGMTNRLKKRGYQFGSWGTPGDGQTWARHLGEQRAAQWQL